MPISKPAVLIQTPPKVEVIRKFRYDLNISQSTMAELLGLASGTRVSEIESGVTQMPPVRWSLMLLALGRHPDFVLTKRQL